MATTSNQHYPRQTLSDVAFFDLEVQDDRSPGGPFARPRPSIARGPWQTVSSRPPPAAARSPAAAAPAQALSVSILTFATADARELRRKLENTLALCRDSSHRTEIIVGCETGDTASLHVARAYGVCGVRVVTWGEGLGALEAWAHLARAAAGDVVVFFDVSARMAPGSLDALLAPMGNEQVGMTVPRYVPCVDEGRGLRACLDAATHGINAACYSGLAVRRRLLQRPAHDTVQPGLVAALQVLGQGHEVVVVPKVRVFHREPSSARARFTSIAQRTHGQLQAAQRQGSELPEECSPIVRAMVRDGMRCVPALGAWLVATLTLAACGQGLLALLLLALGALSVLKAHTERGGAFSFARLDRVGDCLMVGAAQAYGILRAVR